jgi:hypothetical protein
VGSSVIQFFIKVTPLWIELFNQPKLPEASPCLEVFLSRNGFMNIGVMLIPNEEAHAILGRKAFGHFGAMLMHPTAKVVCHTQIQRAIALACQTIDPIIMRHTVIMRQDIGLVIPERQSRIWNPDFHNLDKEARKAGFPPARE